MSTKKPTHTGRANKKAEVSLVRSSVAEYLTFVAASGQGGVTAVYANENVWLTQKMMGLLYDADVRTISYHLKNVFADHELEESSVVQFFRITANGLFRTPTILDHPFPAPQQIRPPSHLASAVAKR